MYLLPDISSLIHLAPLFAFGLWNNSGGNTSSSSTTTVTPTTSGSTSPITQGGGGSNESTQNTGQGSIGVSGTGAKYLEQGATDLAGSGTVSNSSLSASGGGTIQIGSPQAVDALSQVAEQLAQNSSTAVQASSGGGGGGSGGALSWLQPLTQNVNWTMLAMIGGGVFLVYALFGNRRK